MRGTLGTFCLVLALHSGCASTESASRWVDETLYGAARGPAQTAYAGVARVKVYRAPDASSPVEGVLNLHEELIRYQSENGFAYVEAAGNVAGWVREQQLVAARPRAAQPKKVEPAPPRAGETSPPTEAVTEAPAVEPEPAPAPAPEPEPEPDEPEGSVFDPY